MNGLSLSVFNIVPQESGVVYKFSCEFPCKRFVIFMLHWPEDVLIVTNC